MRIAPQLWSTAEALARALTTVRIADSKGEREQIFSFRYSVYVEELKREIGTVDQRRHWLHDPEDDNESTVLFFSTACEGSLTGTARIRCWLAGEAPPDVRDRYAMHRFGGLDSFGTAELGRVMMRGDKRGSRGLHALAGAACGYAAAERRVELCFLTCLPGVVDVYRQLGFRPYDAPLIPTVDGLTIPMVLLLFDGLHLERLGSPLAPLIEASHTARAGLPTGWEELFDPGRLPLQFDADQLLQKVREASGLDSRGSAFLRALGERTLRQLIDHGFLLSVRAGQLVTRKGLVQQELFVIISGTFRVSDGARFVSLGPGELFGEIGFFGSFHQRSASVTAEIDGMLLVIRRRWLEVLKDSDPKGGVDALFELARAMADRLYQESGT